MLLLCPSKDQDIVQIHHHNAFYYRVLEDVVHHGLESDQTIGHPKEHHQGFEHASIGLEGCLPLVSGLNTDVIETPMDIQLGEVSSSSELGHKFGDQWERILVLDRHGVECPIVLNQLEQAIFLLNEEYWSCHGRFGRVNSSGVQVLLQEGI